MDDTYAVGGVVTCDGRGGVANATLAPNEEVEGEVGREDRRGAVRGSSHIGCGSYCDTTTAGVPTKRMLGPPVSVCVLRIGRGGSEGKTGRIGVLDFFFHENILDSAGGVGREEWICSCLRSRGEGAFCRSLEGRAKGIFLRVNECGVCVCGVRE